MKNNEKIYTVITTAKYKKSYRKMVKRGVDIRTLDKVVKKLSYGKQLGFKYHDHILKGKYSGFHECHLMPDWLLIYKIEDDILILTLIDTGSHADLFDM